MGIAITWCRDQGRASELAHFFADNVDSDYISHGELQEGRAVSPGEWRENLPEILLHEMEPRLAEAQQAAPGPVSRPIAVAEEGGTLAGLTLVTFVGEARTPFAVIEDFIVANDRRRQGIGATFMDWIAAEARSRGILRLFLESGVQNNDAHHFFQRLGFSSCSIVMLRSLNPADR